MSVNAWTEYQERKSGSAPKYSDADVVEPPKPEPPPPTPFFGEK